MSTDATDRTDLRGELINRLLKIVAAGGAIAYVPSVWLAVKHELWAVVTLDTLALGLVVVLALLPSLPVLWKIASVLVITYGLGLLLLLWTGPTGAGHLFLFTFVFLSVLFFQNKGIVLANALVIATHGFLLAGSALGMLAWEQSFDSVVVISANYILVSLLLTGAAQFLIRGYERAAREEKRLREVTEMLLREVEHRVKNNLQVISSLVSVRSRAAKTAEEALVQIRDSLSSMAAVQHLLYRRDYEYLVELSNLLQTLVERFRGFHRPWELEYRWTGRPVEVGSEQAVTLGLLLNEIVMNSVRHAVPPEKGLITVTAAFDGDLGNLTLSVGDNGQGLEGAAEGSGTKIIRALAQQLSATLDRKSGPGLTYTLVMPISPARQGGSR